MYKVAAALKEAVRISTSLVATHISEPVNVVHPNTLL